jgi:hypothetical protein
LYGSDADSRLARGLYTDKLWQSHADPDANFNARAANTDAQATSDTTASPLRVKWIR